VASELPAYSQVYLLYLWHQPGAIDGAMGRLTGSAMIAFQDQAGLRLTDDIDSKTLSALRAKTVGA
jgi:peptidoglycan hydrolase-like protein with peptidoglycan-binding domain